MPETVLYQRIKSNVLASSLSIRPSENEPFSVKKTKRFKYLGLHKLNMGKKRNVKISKYFGIIEPDPETGKTFKETKKPDYQRI